MSTDFERIEEEIEVPRETGIDGFLLAIRAVLKKPRVQTVHIDARGKITVSRFVRANEPQVEFSIDFASVTPASAVRRGEVVELTVPEAEDPKTTVFRLFNEAARDQVYPVAFVVGAQSAFRKWVAGSLDVYGSSLFGLRVLSDRHIPDDVLILVTAYGPSGDLVDVQRCYKVTLPLTQPSAAFLAVPVVKIEEGETTV